jgi:hypothetical protein
MDSSTHSTFFTYKKLKEQLLILLFTFSTISFSWNPFVILIPLLLMLSFLKLFYIKFSLNYVLLISMIYLVLKSFSTQIFYIESIRNIMIACLIPIMYLCFYNIEYNYFLKLLKSVFFASIVVVLFIVLIEVPKDFNLFFGDRRGFHAREYLFFGREYPFSLGVTHLNIYINFIFTYLFIYLVNYKKSRKIILFFIVFISIALLTNSRSPILFLIIISFIFRKYSGQINERSVLKKVMITLVVFLISLIGLFNYNYLLNLINTSERLLDISRLIFFLKGYKHMLLEPWGNSLLYIDKMPMLNYHNTFLALGNKIGFWFFVFLILSFILSIIYIRKIKKINIRYTFYMLLYFCFHNYMLEDVVKFDYFVMLIQFSILPFLIFNKQIYSYD